jgi:enoyl-CoA hydratase/carnithine racemase
MQTDLLVSRDAAIATVTLNRPTKRNALTRAMWADLGTTLTTLSADEDLRCVVLRGAGGEAFAAGADIAEFATTRNSHEQAREYGALIEAAMHAVAHCRHPTIALIEGLCVGGGLEIAAMCDLRICGTSSRFGIPINALGLTMAYGELAGLLGLVGRAVALELLLEGRIINASEAYSKGLVNRVVADDAVASESYATAQRIAAGAPLVARWHKQYIERLTVQANISATERDAAYACFDTADYQAGVAAFVEKKKPVFTGR